VIKSCEIVYILSNIFSQFLFDLHVHINILCTHLEFSPHIHGKLWKKLTRIETKK
jgi:hypothetical protein